ERVQGTRRRRNCACPACKHDRSLGCIKPFACRDEAVKLLDSLHPKWDPRRTIYQSNPGLTVDKQMENKLAFNDKKPVTFDPNITLQSSIALGFRAFVNKPRSKNPADQLPTVNAVPNPELTLYIAGAFCMNDDGEPCAGGGAWLSASHPKNRAVGVPY
ncbi:hypothetical protein B0H13DRAFT_1567846, partial [Mycena leptocephala]